MHFDIVIIGGGMVGATLALALEKSTINIAVVDSLPLNIKTDERLIALNEGSACLYENLGLWPQLFPHAGKIKTVHVSHKGRFGMTRIHAKEIGLSALGYVVPAKHINAALDAQLKTSNITIFRPATLEALEQNAEGVTLQIRTEEKIESLYAKKVYGADGSFSTVRNLLDIPIEKIDYQQSALVTVTELQRSHEEIAYERFLSEGAIAMLPLSGQSVATIWTDKNERIKELMSLNDSDFISELQKHFGYRLGRFFNIHKRAVYPLQSIRAKTNGKNHVTLLGNALHTVHPLAAQGLNLALYEVAAIASGGAGYSGFSGELGHRLNWLFSTDLFLFNQARQFAMVGLDIFSPLKKRFAKRAMGREGLVPELLMRKEV